MQTKTLEVSPGPNAQTVIHADGTELNIPSGWECLPPGDAGLTRRVKALGPTWTVKKRKGRRVFSHGVWADKKQIENARSAVDQTRSTASYQKRKVADKNRREKKQAVYMDEFRDAVLEFLDFDSRYDDLVDAIANAVTKHATPVGSGTVARTERIPVEERAAAAVIAWMRHSTTNYDNMTIKRVKGERRAVRRHLAKQSHRLLDIYRRGEEVDPVACPIRRALKL